MLIGSYQMSESPLTHDKLYVVSFETNDTVWGEVYIERNKDAGLQVQIAFDTPYQRFLAFVLLQYAIREIKAEEEAPEWKVKMLSWAAMLNRLEDEEERENPPPPPTDDYPF